MKTINEIGTDKCVLLTQSIGEAYLSRRENERTATTRHVLAIAKCITKVGWFGSKIYVTRNGELLDGQNRLLALRELGWPSVHVNLRIFDDEIVTPELRAAFNKSRPQALRDTMKMSFAWGANASRKVPVYSALTRVCCGRSIPIDEYLMMNVDDSFPEKLLPLVGSGSGKELCADIKSAFLLAGLSDVTRATALRDDLCSMVFPTTKCHARRIFDYLNSDENKASDYKKNSNRKGHGVSTEMAMRVLYAIDAYIKGVACPVLANVDQKRIDDVANPYIELMRRTVNFK